MTSPRLRGEVGFYAKRKIRVRGTLSESNAWIEPLTPTLSPQERGEGAENTLPRSRGAIRPGYALSFAPQEKRARGMPGARCTRGLVCKIVRKNAHEHTGSAESIRHSLRNGFTAYSALSPATNSFCHRHRRISGFARPGRVRKDLRRFSTSNGCQNHTLLPYASAPFVWRAVASLTGPTDLPCDDDRARRCRVHRIPAQR